VECFTLFLFLEDVKSRLRLMGNYSRSVNVDIHVAGVIGMTAEGGGGGKATAILPCGRRDWDWDREWGQ
jgi:hypothetical protein